MSANSDLLSYDDMYANLPPDGWEWADNQDSYQYAQEYPPGYRPGSIDQSIILGVLVGIMVTLGVIWAASLQHQPTATITAGETAVSQPNTQPETSAPIIGDPLAFIAPYAQYTITQGPHGMSYGHYAIDLAAGRGSEITSPINGVVAQLYVDEYGNPTLVIENEVYVVTFLHGDYSVAVGDKLKAGQPIGAESNKGYTMDMAGNLCYNREWCGNHTHLNVYDKRIRSNVNPLELFN
jgi:hypothetical protein